MEENSYKAPVKSESSHAPDKTGWEHGDLLAAIFLAALAAAIWVSLLP